MFSMPPTVSDFKEQFNREFVYGDGLDTIQNNDIERALKEAGFDFPADLFDPTTDGPVAYMYLSAHLMSMNIRNAGGLSPVPAGKGTNSQSAWAINTKSVGQVSVSFTLPPGLAENKILAPYTLTGFGQRYLQMIVPFMVGNGYVVAGFNDTGAPNDLP